MINAINFKIKTLVTLPGFCGVARAGVFFPDRYEHNGTLAGFVLFGGGV